MIRVLSGKEESQPGEYIWEYKTGWGGDEPVTVWRGRVMDDM